MCIGYKARRKVGYTLALISRVHTHKHTHTLISLAPFYISDEHTHARLELVSNAPMAARWYANACGEEARYVFSLPFEVPLCLPNRW